MLLLRKSALEKVRVGALAQKEGPEKVRVGALAYLAAHVLGLVAPESHLLHFDPLPLLDHFPQDC